MAERGAWNLLHHLRMLPGVPEPPPPTVWLSPTEVLRSPETGMFRPAVLPGASVAEGELLGVLSDWFGETLREVRAPFAGLVTYVVATPPVAAGEPLAMIGRPRTEPV
jgi:predicted deacylase